MEVDVEFNQQPDETKRYKTLEIEANEPFNADSEDGIEIAGDAIQFDDPSSVNNYRADMVSRLKAEQFRFRNGIFKADLLRNAKTTSTTFSVLDLLNGAPLKGRTLTLRLKNDTTNETVVRSVAMKIELIK